MKLHFPLKRCSQYSDEPKSDHNEVAQVTFRSNCSKIERIKSCPVIEGQWYDSAERAHRINFGITSIASFWKIIKSKKRYFVRSVIPSSLRTGIILAISYRFSPLIYVMNSPYTAKSWFWDCLVWTGKYSKV